MFVCSHIFPRAVAHFFYETSWCSDNFWHSTFGNRSATALKPICNWSPTIKFCTLVVYGRSFFRISERPFGRRRNRWAILVSFYQTKAGLFSSHSLPVIYHVYFFCRMLCMPFRYLHCPAATWHSWYLLVTSSEIPPPPNLPLQLYDFHILVI